MSFGLSFIALDLGTLLFYVSQPLVDLRVLRRSLLYHLLVDHDDEGAFVGLVAELAALAKEHRYLVDFQHDVREKELLAMHGLLLVKDDRLAATCHVCIARERFETHASFLQVELYPLFIIFQLDLSANRLQSFEELC